MATYNAITNTTTLQVLRWGASTFVAGSGETLTLDVGPWPVGVPLQYTKVDGGALVEMSGAEKVIVDATQSTVNDVLSEGAVVVERIYANEAALPATPARNGLLVALTTTDAGSPGLALSVGGSWYTIHSGDDAP